MGGGGTGGGEGGGGGERETNLDKKRDTKPQQLVPILMTTLLPNMIDLVIFVLGSIKKVYLMLVLWR